MKFTDLFIRRPVVALVVNLLILIAGIQAIRSLNVRQYPRNENAEITVTTVYVGAPAELVRGFVTTPLERAIASADGIDYLQSESKLGLSTITARLRLNYDATKALAEIGSKVDQVRGDLPPEADVPILHIASADSQFPSALLSREEFEQMVGRQADGGTVRLRDVADVVLGAEDYDTAVNFTGQTAVFIGVWSLPNANSLDVIKRVRVELDSLKKELPEQI